MRAITFLLLLVVVGCLFAGSKGPSPDQLAAEDSVAIAAKQDSLDFEKRKALSLGLEYYKNAQYDDAIPYFRRIINELDPDEERAWKYLADSYLRQGKPDSAMAVYLDGIAKFPDRGYLHRGCALIIQGRASENPDAQQELLQEALEGYKTACSLDESDAFSAEQIARIYLSQAKLDSAMIWFEVAAMADSNNADIWERLADLYMIRGNWTGVLNAYTNLHRIKPENPEYLLNKGRAQANTGNYSEAVSTLDDYIKNNPADARGYQYMGLVHAANNKYSDAMKSFAEAEKLDPRNVKLLLDMADIYVDMKQFDNAASYLNKARRVEPDNCQAIVVEGNICVGRARANVPAEGIGVREKLSFECCHEIYRRARRSDCGRWANVAKSKMDFINQYLPTEQEKNEFFFIHPELRGKICQ
jgi:tetratricopeptide (TPR) repeat protein